MVDPDMLHCLCGYTCGTKAALEKHIQRFVNTEESQLHGVDPEPLSPLKKATKHRPQLETDLDSPLLGMSLRSVGSGITVPPSPMTPLSPDMKHGDLGLAARRALFVAEPALAMTPGDANARVRLILIRHAQSANKCRRSGERAVSDPDLSDLGYEQAQALGRRLRDEFGGARGRRLRVVSSPMRRCLLTIQPAVQMLKLPPEQCLAHGASYEYGCAGRAFAGSTSADIARDFPEFRPVGFGPGGAWDYLGESDKENERECRQRAAGVVQWLQKLAAEEREAASRDGEPARTLILTTHQTVADLLCHLLLLGRADKWSYGEITYKLQNACLTELFLYPDGRASFGFMNDSSHLMSLRFRLNLV